MTGPNPWSTVCGTGHRTLRPGSQIWLHDKLAAGMVWLRDTKGCRVVISGMARGFDLWLAAAALAAGLELHAYLPFVEQAAKWSRADRAEWERLRAAASHVKVCGQINPEIVRVCGSLDPATVAHARGKAVNRLLHHRDDEMLDAAGAVFALWEPDRFEGSGTYATLLKAVGRKMPGVHLDPVTRTVSARLPDLSRLRPAVRELTAAGSTTPANPH